MLLKGRVSFKTEKVLKVHVHVNNNIKLHVVLYNMTHLSLMSECTHARGKTVINVRDEGATPC